MKIFTQILFRQKRKYSVLSLILLSILYNFYVFQNFHLLLNINRIALNKLNI